MLSEVKLHIQNGHPVDIHADDETRPCSSFLLLANVPADPPACLLLSYGDSDKIANLLMTMWQRCVHEDPKMAWTLEQTARGIVEMADKERANWPSDETIVGRA